MLPRLMRPPRLRGGPDKAGQRSDLARAFLRSGLRRGDRRAGRQAQRRLLARGHPKVHRIVRAGVMAWVGRTIYATRFDTDDVAHRRGTFALKLAAAVLFTASGAYAPLTFVPGGLLAVFVLALISEMHYWRAWYRIKPPA